MASIAASSAERLRFAGSVLGRVMASALGRGMPIAGPAAIADAAESAPSRNWRRLKESLANRFESYSSLHSRLIFSKSAPIMLLALVDSVRLLDNSCGEEMIDFVDLDGRFHLVHDSSVRSRIAVIEICPRSLSVRLVLADGTGIALALGRGDAERLSAAQTALVVPVGGIGSFATYEVPTAAMAGEIA